MLPWVSHERGTSPGEPIVRDSKLPVDTCEGAGAVVMVGGQGSGIRVTWSFSVTLTFDEAVAVPEFCIVQIDN